MIFVVARFVATLLSNNFASNIMQRFDSMFYYFTCLQSYTFPSIYGFITQIIVNLKEK